MFIHRRRGWEIPSSRITPEAVALGRRGVSRRALVGGVAAVGIIGAAGTAQAGWFSSAPSAPPPVLKSLTAQHNARYVVDRPITPESDVTHYNNYYEFGDSKSVSDAAAALKVEPWSIEIAGMVKTPRTIGYDDLMKRVSLEERVYRHRCVEAWAMTVPWIGFPMADLVKMAEPLGSATYLKFTTLADDKTMPGLRQSWYPWPYTEGLTVQEAMNELAFLSVGLYGKTLPPQNGAPIRVTVPWKYGFKSAKSIVKVEFTDQRPKTFWEQLQDSEYGFWANVNPAVPHPRWSQEQERLLGSGEMVPTRIWNGYGELVAAMYADKTKERLFV
jgi:methionine sulfoxide reductase catalytic subunit